MDKFRKWLARLLDPQMAKEQQAFWRMWRNADDIRNWCGVTHPEAASAAQLLIDQDAWFWGRESDKRDLPWRAGTLTTQITDYRNWLDRLPFAKPSFQSRVSDAHHALYHDDPTDVAERRARFLEEAYETVQAFGMTEDEANALAVYSFGRPVGERDKEIGAAMVTLTALCVVAGYDLMTCAEADLEKLVKPETIARIRAKRATRHGRGPLPGLSADICLNCGRQKNNDGKCQTCDTFCLDCGRQKAKNVTDALNGLCPKWWAIYDADADRDCVNHAKAFKKDGE